MSPPPYPGGDLGPEQPSDVKMLSQHEYRIRSEALERKIAAEKAADMGKAAADAFTRRLWAVGASAVVLVLGTVGTIAWGKSQIDAGVAPLKAEIAETRLDGTADRRRLELRLDRQDDKVDRLDKKIDLLLDDAKVPKWKRPLEPDGGR